MANRCWLRARSEKAKYTFKRKAPDQAGKPYTLPDLGAPADLNATIGAVSTDDGSATFDVKLGMLDNLTEDYTTEMTLRYNDDAIKRKLRVQYRLKRVLPPIRQEH